MAVAGGQLASAVSAKVVRRAEKELHQTKIILRHLPPDFSEEKLLEVISPLPNHTFFYFFAGDPSLGRYGCARAYIDFKNESDIISFRDQYDGTTLESAKGVRYRMVIEFAPFQSLPRRKKPDPRCGTIEQDSEYLAFVEEYQATAKPLPSVELSYLDELMSAGRTSEVKMTPLVEYLKDRRSSKHRGSRNKVVLFAVDSKRKKDRMKGDGHKSTKKGGGKEGGRSGKPSSGEKRESGKKKQTREKGEEAVGKAVVILGREKPKKSLSSNGDASLHVLTKGREVEDKGQSMMVDGGTASAASGAFKSSSDTHVVGGGKKEVIDSPSTKSKQVRNKDRPDQKFYMPRGGRRQVSDVTEEKKSDEGFGYTRRGEGSTMKDERKGRSERGESGGGWEGRRGGGGGKRGRYPKPSGRYNDHDRYWGNDRYYYRDVEYRGHSGRSGGEVEHEYHFQDDYGDTGGGGSRKGGGRYSSKGRDYRREGQYGGYGGGGGGGDTRSYHK